MLVLARVVREQVLVTVRLVQLKVRLTAVAWVAAQRMLARAQMVGPAVCERRPDQSCGQGCALASVALDRPRSRWKRRPR